MKKAAQRFRSSRKPAPDQAKHTPASQDPPKSVHERYTVAQLREALTHARGMCSAAAKVLGCSRRAVQDYIHRHPELAEHLAEARDMQKDLTELSLFRAIDKGESWAVLYYLKTQCRDRGYIEKVDIGADASTLEQLVTLATEKFQAIQAKRKAQVHA